MSRKPKKDRGNKAWIRGTREKILQGIGGKEQPKPVGEEKPPEPKPPLPGAKVDPQEPTQRPLDIEEGHAEDAPIETNGVRKVVYSARVREKECLAAFNEGFKAIQEEHKGVFVQEFREHRVQGHYKPRIRFYLLDSASEGKKAEEVAALEKAGREAIVALIAALAEKYDGEFRQVMMAVKPDKDGVGAGEYKCEIQFAAH